jgi:hypothetical protein
MLPTGTILPAEHRQVRDLARKRMQLVRSRTSHILAVENITARQSGTRITSNQVKQLDQATVGQLHRRLSRSVRQWQQEFQALNDPRFFRARSSAANTHARAASTSAVRPSASARRGS